MPSTLRATVSLDPPAWEWHKRNPGRISRLTQVAIQDMIALEALPDKRFDDAVEFALRDFQRNWLENLAGDYAIQNEVLVRGKATDDQILRDAVWLDVEPDQVLVVLGRLLDQTLDNALRLTIILDSGRT